MGAFIKYTEIYQIYLPCLLQSCHTSLEHQTIICSCTENDSNVSIKYLICHKSNALQMHPVSYQAEVI